MTDYWVDYSAAKLTGSVIKSWSNGVDRLTGAIRYIDAPDHLRTKHTNKSEYDSLIAAGLTVRLVFQNTTTDADTGFAGGVANALRAKAGADSLGYRGVIFFCNDRTTVPNVNSWREYLRGAASVLGIERVGAYGFANALNAAVGYASAFWQAGRLSERVPHSNYWQDNNTQITVGGVTCDRNRVWNDYDVGEDVKVPPVNSRDEEDEMQPVTLAASPEEIMKSFIWDGRKAVLNLIVDTDEVFVSRLLNWGPAGGTGGGGATTNIPVTPTGWRVTVNQPGQFDIPAGTTRVVIPYSSAASVVAQIVAV